MNPTCPTCGQQMTKTRVEDAPPWVCRNCARAFWTAELTPAARKEWDPDARSFGADVRAAAEDEAGLS